MKIPGVKKILILLVAFFLSGCASGTYKIGNRTFSSTIEAEQFQAQQINQTIIAISPTNTPVGGRALIAIPTSELIEKEYIKIIGSSSINKESLESLKKVIMNSLESIHAALERRKIFNKVTLVHSNNPSQMFFEGYDFLIYNRSTSYGKNKWYIKNHYQGEGAFVKVEKGVSDSFSFTLSLLDSIESQSRQMHVAQKQDETQRKTAEKLSKKLEQAIEEGRWEDAKNIQALIKGMKQPEKVVVETNNRSNRFSAEECENAKQDYEQAEAAYNNAQGGRNTNRQEGTMAHLLHGTNKKTDLLFGLWAESSRQDAHDYQKDMDYAQDLMRDAKNRMSIHCRD